jgi:hypothetical protein
VIPAEVLEINPSLAVKVLDPAVFRFRAKDPTPFVRVAGAGRTAAPSEEVMVTAPEYPVTVLPLESFAVTLMLNGVPAVAFAGTDPSTNWDARFEFTVIPEEVMERTPSFAVRVWLPVDLRVVVKLPTPLVSVAAGGRVAAGSEDAMLIEPVYPVALFPSWSFAVTVKLKELPATTEDGTKVKAKELAGPGSTVRFAVLVNTEPGATSARMETAPERTGLKVAVYTPLPALVGGLIVPVPPTRLGRKVRADAAGAPEGFKFPKASFNVSVRPSVLPTETVDALAVRVLVAME